MLNYLPVNIAAESFGNGSQQQKAGDIRVGREHPSDGAAQVPRFIGGNDFIQNRLKTIEPILLRTQNFC